MNTLDVLLSLLPLCLLIYWIAKRKSMPSFQALPLAAGVLYLLRITYFSSDPTTLHAGILSGLLTAWTPILIIWGAVLLFRTIKSCGALKTIFIWLHHVTENKIAQVMIIAWAFSFLVEGVSGFGTPVALAAPLLVGLGFSPVKVVVVCLVMNTIPVSFGAVGTPTWFGFENLGLENQDLLNIAKQTALIHFLAGFIIPFFALRFLFSWEEIRKNIIFRFNLT